MLHLEGFKQQVDEHKSKYSTFQDSEKMNEYRQKYQEIITAAIQSFQKIEPRFHRLLLQSNDKGYLSLEKSITDGDPTFFVNLSIANMFSMGYSTNVDLEIQEDCDSILKTEKIEILRKDKKPLFNERHSKISTNLGTLSISIKNMPQKPAFPERSEIKPSNTMGITEINNREYYKESKSLSDQLAYFFYENTGFNAENFCRLGDHHNYSGINGLSVALYFLIENYAYNEENTYKQAIYSSHTDTIKHSPIISEFNKIFAGYFEIDVTSKPGYMIYKLVE